MFSVPGRKSRAPACIARRIVCGVAVLGRHDHRRPMRVLLFGELAEVVIAALGELMTRTSGTGCKPYNGSAWPFSMCRKCSS